MTVYNLGSINADYFYRVPHFPAPGETLSAVNFSSGLGGKGANQSVAAAKAGADVRHIGAVGQDGGWAVEKLNSYGVKTDHIAQVDVPTAHAIITLDPSGENSIVLFPGANIAQDMGRIETALGSATSADTLLLQNETSCQAEAAKRAADLGMRVVYSAAPFELSAIEAVLPYVTMLAVNEIEAQQLTDAMGYALADLPVAQVLVTKGSEGATLYDLKAEHQIDTRSFPVKVVDTTGAGDTFTGVLAAGLDQGLPAEVAMQRASASAAVKVTRAGTADAIPDASEVDAFLKGSGA